MTEPFIINFNCSSMIHCITTTSISVTAKYFLPVFATRTFIAGFWNSLQRRATSTQRPPLFSSLYLAATCQFLEGGLLIYNRGSTVLSTVCVFSSPPDPSLCAPMYAGYDFAATSLRICREKKEGQSLWQSQNGNVLSSVRHVTNCLNRPL